MSMFWGGSSMRARELKPSLKYLYPKEGVLAWVDNLVIPRGSRNRTTRGASSPSSLSRRTPR